MKSMMRPWLTNSGYWLATLEDQTFLGKGSWAHLVKFRFDVLMLTAVSLVAVGTHPFV